MSARVYAFSAYGKDRSQPMAPAVVERCESPVGVAATEALEHAERSLARVTAFLEAALSPAELAEYRVRTRLTEPPDPPELRQWSALPVTTFVGPMGRRERSDEMPMPPARHEYKGKSLTRRELVALPEATPGLTDRQFADRIRRGLTVEQALVTPIDENQARPGPRKRATKPSPAPRPIAEEAREVARATAATLDPLVLLERLGVPHELLGETAKGRVVFLPAGSPEAA